jgi:glycosyltransferase involved in cell wall biosynthesis
MKVAIVTSYVNATGGVETFNRDIRSLLKLKGHEVFTYGVDSLKNIPKENIEKKVGLYFNQQNKVEKFDVVLCNGEFGYSVEHSKAINIFHGSYYGYALAVKDLVSSELTELRLKKAELQRESSKGKYVVTISDSSKNQLEDFGIKVNQVINNSVNPNIFHPSDMEIGNCAIAVSRGRYYEKGLDIIKRLGDKGLQINLFSDLEIVSPNVINKGFIPNEKLACEYNKSKILIFPTRFEGGGLTSLEAMACGCPIITTPTGYGLELKSSIHNFVADSFDEFFVKSLLVSDERERYSKLAFDYFWSNHNPDEFKKNWINLIESI